MINRCGRDTNKKALKKRIGKEKGIIDGIWFLGEEFRKTYNISQLTNKGNQISDYYIATWRIKE